MEIQNKIPIVQLFDNNESTSTGRRNFEALASAGTAYAAGHLGGMAIYASRPKEPEMDAITRAALADMDGTAPKDPGAGHIRAGRAVWAAGAVAAAGIMAMSPMGKPVVSAIGNGLSSGAGAAWNGVMNLKDRIGD